MRKGLVTLWVMLMAGYVSAATFTDINSPQYEGKTADKARNAAIDANFALIEAGTVTATQEADSLLVGSSTSNQTAMTVAAGSEVTLSSDDTNVTFTIAEDVVDGESLEDVDPGYIFVGSATSNAEPVAVSGVITMANDGTTALATAVADQIAYLTIAGADLATNGTGTITIQLKDQAGNDLAAAALVRTWIGTANDYGVDALTDYSVSTGTQKEEVTANGEYLAITDGSGTIVMAVDYAGGGAGSVYAWAEVGGRIVASGEVALTAP